MRRRSGFAAIVVGIVVLAALMPAAVLADGSTSGAARHGTSVHAQYPPPTSSLVDIESGRGWCDTATNCTNGEFYTGPATGHYAEVDAYQYSGVTHTTPDEIYAECGTYWTDSMGVRHYDYAYVDAYLADGEITNSSLLWLMNSGSESNTQAMATVRATGSASTSGDGQTNFTGFDAATISGFGTFNNNTDKTFTNSGFTVNLFGTIYHDTVDQTYGYLTTQFTTIGAMTCNTVPLAENGLFPPFQYQFDLFGEAELESNNF